MPRKPGAGRNSWSTPDDAPELNEAFFSRATLYDGPRPVRRGRPLAAAPKQQVTLRLSADLLADLRATGPGWQTRVNAALREWMDRQTDPA